MIVVNDKAYITPNITLYPADLIRLTAEHKESGKGLSLVTGSVSSVAIRFPPISRYQWQYQASFQ